MRDSPRANLGFAANNFPWLKQIQQWRQQHKRGAGYPKVNASSAHSESESSAHIANESSAHRETASSAHKERSSAHIDAGNQPFGFGWGGVGGVGGVGWGGVG